MHKLTLIGSNRVTWCEALTWLPAFFLLLTQTQMESLMSPHHSTNLRVVLSNYNSKLPRNIQCLDEIAPGQNVLGVCCSSSDFLYVEKQKGWENLVFVIRQLNCMEENEMETQVCIKKSQQTLTTTHLCICSQRKSETGNQNWIWGSTRSGGVGVMLYKFSIRRGIQMLYKWTIDVSNTVY